MLLVKDAIRTLNNLYDGYDNLRANIADEFNDNNIEIALEKVERLKSLKKAIETIENLEVKMEVEMLK